MTYELAKELKDNGFPQAGDDEINNVFGGTLIYSYEEGGNMLYRGKSYIYHLQQMVISEDPIKYLEQFI